MHKWFLSLLLSAGLLTGLFLGIDRNAIGRSFANLHWPFIAWAVLFYLAGLLFRAWRYRMLLNRPVGMGPMVQVTAVRNMFADLLPARAGTAVYVYLVVRRFGADLGDALSSFFTVFILDIASLAPLLGIGLLSLTGDGGEGSLVALVLPAFLLLALAAGALQLLGPLIRAARHLVGSGSPWRDRAGRILGDILDEYAALRRRGILLPAFAVSLGVRLMKYASWYCLLLAVLQGLPGAPAVLPFGRALVGTIGAELSSALPIGGIAGFGTYEAAWSLSFGALGFSRELAVISGFATHLLSQFIDYGLGIVALLWLYRPRLSGPAMRWAAAATAAGALSVAAYGGRHIWVRTFPPATHHVSTPLLEQEAFRKAAALIGSPARIIWSSNRSGNHELYALDLPEGRLRKLTDHPAVDYYSRFSPDGSEILFLRSRREWVSFRDSEKWDVLVMDSGGGAPRLLSEGAYHPSWWPDGKSVVYTRSGKLIRHHLGDGREEVLVDGSLAPFNGWLGTPYVSPAGDSVALTVRGSWRGVGVWEMEENDLRRLDSADGCQLAWRPDGSGLIWVAGGGKGKNRILHLPRGETEPSLLLDLPGRFSHEYFPRVSNDGRFLIFAAAAEGHEHDRADYELFLWKIGTPAGEALRLTWHGGNDQWPDLWIEPDE